MTATDFEGESPIELALHKLDVAFEFFEKLGAPFFTFHDRDIAPEGATIRNSGDCSSWWI